MPRGWWRRWPDAFPVVAPDRSGLAVIDIDNRIGEPNGFTETDAAGAPVTASWQSKSASGRGLHLWYRGQNKTTSAVNGIRSVDSRGYPGLVFIHDDYEELPPAEAITEAIPQPYRAEPRATGTTSAVAATISEWVAALDFGPASEAVEVAGALVLGKGMSHQDMLDATDELVRHAT